MVPGLTLADVAGLAGAVLLCAAYGLAARGRIEAAGVAYNLMNLGGAALLLVTFAIWRAPAGLALGLLWAGLALTALARFIGRR